ncbi:unnamed protein product [Acanthoscelides obtectus]|uniref:MADF domain-containing protein n=1 Tax=Acanthoscelides obtectus TaxID=200917 RepID=A0A9P0PDC7_ACAOB|nr:unnamed protein product [Acanthoscelides obtectus]CAK1638178.1 hypothetical protein AOBTE_LOCUS10431 [Acanthoscelides obtectus]
MNTEELITSIFMKKALWDQKDPQHHNRFILDKLWDAVAKEMNSTIHTSLVMRTFYSNVLPVDSS